MWSTGASTMRPSSTQTPPPASASARHRRCAWATTAGSGSKTACRLHLGRVNAQLAAKAHGAWRAPRPMPVVRVARFHGHAVHDRGANAGPARGQDQGLRMGSSSSSPQAMPASTWKSRWPKASRTTWEERQAVVAAASSPATPSIRGSKAACAPAARATACRVWARSALETTTPATPISTSCASARRSSACQGCAFGVDAHQQACALRAFQRFHGLGQRLARALLVGRSHGVSSRRSPCRHRCPWPFQSVRGAWQERKRKEVACRARSCMRMSLKNGLFG